MKKYNKEWKSKEKFIDDKFTKKNQSKQKVLRDNLPGASVSDILIVRNWLAYAKIIGDLSYKKISKKITISSVAKKKISGYLLRRKKEFSSSPD